MMQPSQDPGLRWIGPFRLRDYFDRCIDPTQERPPEAPGVYVVSRNSWNPRPSASCQPLYVGGNPKKPTYFRRRVGFLVMRTSSSRAAGEKTARKRPASSALKT